MNDLVTIILGSSNELFDGKILSSSHNNYHIEALCKINENLINYFNFNLGYFNLNDINSAAYDVVNNGHILFTDISFDESKIGILYLPDYISDNQKNSLDVLKEKTKNYKMMNLKIENKQLVYKK